MFGEHGKLVSIAGDGRREQSLKKFYYRVKRIQRYKYYNVILLLDSNLDHAILVFTRVSDTAMLRLLINHRYNNKAGKTKNAPNENSQ